MGGEGDTPEQQQLVVGGPGGEAEPAKLDKKARRRKKGVYRRY